MALMAEEDAIMHQHAPRYYLRALGIYGIPAEFGQWRVSYGPSANFRARSEVAATDAGILLGSPPMEVRPLNRWLHTLYVHLRQADPYSDHLKTADTGGFVIDRVCEASATYCARLHVQAVEEPLYPQVQIPSFLEDTNSTGIGHRTEVDAFLAECLRIVGMSSAQFRISHPR